MRYLSVCSGIEAATVAWHPLGWEPVAFSEIESFPSKVLAHHYPSIPNLGDMTKFKEWPDANVDVLVGGTPCQSFSVAGLRKGLDDPRGNLMLTYLAIAAKYRPEWLVWENVPGVLSSNGGRDFASLLRGMAELGYGFAYRVLDAQYFGVAQRRRRVFVVGCLGDWRRAAAVLFERDSLSRNPEPRREAGKGATGTIEARTSGGSLELNGVDLIPQVSPALKARDSKGPSSDGDGDGDGAPLIPCITHSLRSMGHDGSHANGGGQVAVAFHENQRAEITTNDTAGALGVGGGKPGQGYPAAQIGMQVRRLTPRECERLQGFPDCYTDIRPNGKPTPDGPRYKALGNSMAVPVMAWIGQRIQQVSEIRVAREGVA